MGFFLSQIKGIIMSYRCYDKPYQSSEELLGYVQEKGLDVSDINLAKNFLENINYYRFKVYLKPFFDFSSARYVELASFEKGIELYRFDEDLRSYLFAIICKIEIKLRSKLDRTVASHLDDPFWYLDDSNFMKNQIFSMDNIRASLSSLFRQSRDDFSGHYRATYFNNVSDKFKQLPPFWVISELATLGQILTVYKSLDKTKFSGERNSNKLDSLAHEFGAKNFKELNNWITAIKDVRNRCAHHSRVWNANHRQASSTLTLLDSQYAPGNPNKIYLFCVLLNKINCQLSIGFDIKSDLLDLFHKYPEAQEKSSSAGFSENWHLDAVWSG